MENTTYKVGDWVKDTGSGAYGVVGAVLNNDQYSVKWGSGQENKEDRSQLTPSAPAMYFQSLRSFAEVTLGMSVDDFDKYAEFAKKEMTLEALSELEGQLLDFTPQDPDAEANYESTWQSIEQTAAAQTNDEDDIFGAFDEDPKSTDATAELSPSASIAETVASAAETPAGKHFIAVQKTAIWGVGTTFDEALADATKSFRESVKRAPELGELKVLPCSEALYEVVGRDGGCIDYWQGSSWKVDENGCAVYVFVEPREYKRAEATKRVTVAPCEHHANEFSVCIDGDVVEQHFASAEEAQEAVPDWIDYLLGDDVAPHRQQKPEPAPEAPALNKQAMCAMCGNVKVNKNSPQLADGSKVCKKCELKSKADAIAMTEEPAPKPESGSSEDLAVSAACNSVSEPCSDTTESADTAREATTGEITGDEPIDFGDFISEQPAVTTPIEEPAQPIRTDAGVIDPETGEVLEESFIMRKFGWTELPELSAKPTREELDAYEAKLDQLTDRVLGYLERAARYRASAEMRCKPLDGAAGFYQAAFIEPMGRALAVHRLPRYGPTAKKAGEYSKKTMVLNSGAIQFTQTGGFYVHDKEEVRAAIKKQGIANFANIDAKEVVSYDHNKLMSALKAGTIKDFPGTGKKPVNALANVKLVSPALPPSPGDESEDEE